MEIYAVGVSRIYLVRVRCNSAEDAIRIAENHLEARDGSWPTEREEQQFEFVGSPEIMDSESWLEEKIS